MTEDIRVAALLITACDSGALCQHREIASEKGTEFCGYTGETCPESENCNFPRWGEAIEKMALWDFTAYEKSKGMSDDLIAKRWRHAKEQNLGMYAERIATAERMIKGLYGFEHIPEGAKDE